MSNFVRTAYDINFLLSFKEKNPAKSQGMLKETYDSHALALARCKRQFQRFGNNNFDVRNEEHGRPKQQELLDCKC